MGDKVNPWVMPVNKVNPNCGYFLFIIFCVFTIVAQYNVRDL